MSSRPHTCRLRVIAAAVVAGLSTGALAQPAGAQAIHGTAVLTQQGARTTVTTQNGAGSQHSAINWQSFSVPAASTVFFAQPNAQSTSINRVMGPDPSAIFGNLGSNGKLVLVNPAGIAVGAGAVVDTAGFTASTLFMTQADAVAGRLRFASDPAAPQGQLSVQGRIVARGGDVVLIAPQVETGAQAVVESIGGDTILAAGQKVEITGRGMEGIRMQIQAPGDQAMNLGVLKGDSVAMFAGQLRHSGLIAASSATVSGGRVVLKATGQADIDGRVTASAAQAGGSVHVTAERVSLRDRAALDASGASGGGEVLVGGGWQGRDTRVANASEVDVAAGASLSADATVSGNGGTVVVWSDGTTRFRGLVQARGAGDGRGGNAEVSGKQNLVFRGQANLEGAHGTAGVLLLDPAVVTIEAGSGSNDVSTFYEVDLESLGANISIQASQQIQVNGSFGGGELLISNDRDFKLEVTNGSAGGIDLRGMPVRTQGSGKVDLKTASAGQHIYTGGIRTAGGKIKVEADNANVYLGGAGLNSWGGDIDLRGNTVENSGTITLRGGAELNAPNGLVNLASGVIEGEGEIELGGATLISHGILRPGGTGSVGELEIEGHLVLSSSSQLQMKRSSGGNDVLKVDDGNVTIAGSLSVSALGGYTPGGSDDYTLIDGNNHTGSFATIGAPGFAGFGPVYEAQKMKFKAGTAPAPAPAPAQSSAPVSDSAPVVAPAPQPIQTAAPLAPTTAPPADSVVTVAAREQDRTAESFLLRSNGLQAESSDPEKRERQVRLTAVQCRI